MKWMILRLGSNGELVKILQEFLGIKTDGDFGPVTEKHVKRWQRKNKLVTDGIVGRKTWAAMGLASTDMSESVHDINSLTIKQYFLPKKEYYNGPTKKEYCFLHHTAGWHNPYSVVDSWGRDNRGRIGTEFVLGGQSIKGDSIKYDGELIQCIPEGGFAWHLGNNGSIHMHKHSVGIEVTNFGQLTRGGFYKSKRGAKVWVPGYRDRYYTYVGTEAHGDQVVHLDKEFRGFKHFHRYSNKQIETIKNWILWIAERDNIDIRNGLVKWIHEKGPIKAFDFDADAFYGKVKGLLTHTNTRKTSKWDMFPQQELIDMLVSL